MVASGPPESGTLLLAALLLMVLEFSGYWITSYADPRTAGRPFPVRWFMGAAAVVIGIALVGHPRRGRS